MLKAYEAKKIADNSENSSVFPKRIINSIEDDIKYLSGEGIYYLFYDMMGIINHIGMPDSELWIYKDKTSKEYKALWSSVEGTLKDNGYTVKEEENNRLYIAWNNAKEETDAGTDNAE